MTMHGHSTSLLAATLRASVGVALAAILAVAIVDSYNSILSAFFVTTIGPPFHACTWLWIESFYDLSRLLPNYVGSLAPSVLYLIAITALILVFTSHREVQSPARWVALCLSLSASLLLLAYRYRFLSLLSFVAMVPLLVFFLWRKKFLKTVLILWLLFVLFAYLPVDITLQCLPGRPHWASVIHGLGSHARVEREGHKDVAISECIGFYYEPRYVWVW
jgi:hypothetical protein